MTEQQTEIDIFLSYKREDRATAKALAEVLAARGYNLWWDIDLLPGDRFVDAVTEVIKRARITIVLWSKQAVASDYVRGEAEIARQAGKLLPARLDHCDLPIPFNALQTLDLRSWQKGGDEAPLAPLVAALEQRLGKPTKAEQPTEETDANLHERETEAAVWRSISEKDSIPEYEYYLENFPQGVFAELARMRLESLRQPDMGKSILKVGGIAGAIATIIGLVVLVRDEFGPAIEDIWPASQQTTAEGEPVPSGADAEDQDAPSPLPDLRTRSSPYEPGDKFRDCAKCPEMVVVPAGSFMMGSPEDEADRLDREGPQHQVTIAEPFAIGVHEVTFEEYDSFAAATGRNLLSDRGWGRGRRPVINVSWNDARTYVEWLSERTGEVYRLLSEAEWEYAARAGTTTAYALPAPDGSNNILGKGLANCNGCGNEWDGRQTAPVGSFEANAFGLHDMHGNAWEWVEDVWHDNYDGAPDDGSAWLEGGEQNRRVLRGGSSHFDPEGLRSAFRNRDYTSGRNYYVIGFRVARTLR